MHGTLFLPKSASENESTVFLNFNLTNGRAGDIGHARFGTFDQNFSLVSAGHPIAGNPSPIGTFAIETHSHDFDFFNYQSKQYGLLYSETGLERNFVYVFPESKTLADLGLDVVEPDEIALILPDEASGLEISNSGMIELPPRKREVNGATVYPGSASQSGEDAIRVRFEVPANNYQILLIEYVSKFILVILAPLIGLFLITPKNDAQAKRRKIGIGVLIVSETIVLVVYGLYTYQVRSAWSFELILDIILGSLALLFSAYVAWEKTRSENPT